MYVLEYLLPKEISHNGLITHLPEVLLAHLHEVEEVAHGVLKRSHDTPA